MIVFKGYTRFHRQHWRRSSDAITCISSARLCYSVSFMFSVTFQCAQLTFSGSGWHSVQVQWSSAHLHGFDWLVRYQSHVLLFPLDSSVDRPQLQSRPQGSNPPGRMKVRERANARQSPRLEAWSVRHHGADRRLNSPPRSRLQGRASIAPSPVPLPHRSRGKITLRLRLQGRASIALFPVSLHRPSRGKLSRRLRLQGRLSIAPSPIPLPHRSRVLTFPGGWGFKAGLQSPFSRSRYTADQGVNLPPRLRLQGGGFQSPHTRYCWITDLGC